MSSRGKKKKERKEYEALKKLYQSWWNPTTYPMTCTKQTG